MTSAVAAGVKSEPLGPPPALLEFSFLASATNGFLAALNELRCDTPPRAILSGAAAHFVT